MTSTDQPDEEVVGQKQAAKAADRALATIQQWIRDGLPFSRRPNGVYVFKLSELLAWKDSQRYNEEQGLEDNGSGGDGASVKVAILQEDLRRKAADASLRELQLEKAANRDIVDLEEVEAFLTQLFADSRKLLLRIPTKMKRFGPEAVVSCRKQIELALHGIEKLSQQLVDLRDE